MVNCQKIKPIKNNPDRIVSLSPSNTEILFAIGAGDNIVGVTDYCNYPPEIEVRIKAHEIVRVGGYWDPSVETILELKPDLVLISAAQCNLKTNICKINCSRRCELPIKVANRLKSLGQNVLILSPHSLNDVIANIMLIGDATGCSVQAMDLVKRLKERIAAVASQGVTHRPRVYFEVWNDPYISVNSGTWIGNLIDLAGGINVFSEALTEWPIIRSEDVIQRNPEVMLFPVVPCVPRFWESFEAVKNRSGWQNINAVKSNKLYEISRDCISRPGPRLVESLELLAKILNPTS